MRHEGTIKHVNEKGFGFIFIAEGVKDIFFHCRDLQPPLMFNEQLLERRVSFVACQSDKGPHAMDVRPAF
jgi:cold shock CspA family protein